MTLSSDTDRFPVNQRLAIGGTECDRIAGFQAAENLHADQVDLAYRDPNAVQSATFDPVDVVLALLDMQCVAWNRQYIRFISSGDGHTNIGIGQQHIVGVFYRHQNFANVAGTVSDDRRGEAEDLTM